MGYYLSFGLGGDGDGDADGDGDGDGDGHLQRVSGQHYPSFGLDQLQSLRDRRMRILYPE